MYVVNSCKFRILHRHGMHSWWNIQRFSGSLDQTHWTFARGQAASTTVYTGDFETYFEFRGQLIFHFVVLGVMMCRMPGKNYMFWLKTTKQFSWIRSQAQIEAASFIQQARGAKSPSSTFQHWNQSEWTENRVSFSFYFWWCVYVCCLKHLETSEVSRGFKHQTWVKRPLHH